MAGTIEIIEVGPRDGLQNQDVTLSIADRVALTAKLIEAARLVFAQEPDVQVDYVAVVDPDTLEDVADVSDGALVAVAAFVGTTRLIDNILLAWRE